MAGPAKNKKRAQAEKKGSGSSEGHEHRSQNESSGKELTTERSTPKSLPRLDGNRDPAPATGQRKAVDYSRPNDLKNISEFLGMSGWYVARGFDIPERLPARPEKFNTLGREIGMTLNTFNLMSSPSAMVHQYDVSWGANTDSTKRVLLKKIWESKAVKMALGEPGNLWVYDGNKLAWCGKRLERDDVRITVDLDAEQGRQSRGERKNVHTIHLRWTRKVDFAHLNAFLNGQASWSAECIDTINFLDHVMREKPSRKYTQIKKSFFKRGEQRFDLGGGLEAFKGVYASLRPVLNDQREKGLSVNVDVANGTFWRAQALDRALMQVFGCSNIAAFQTMFTTAKRDWRASSLRKDLGRFKRVGVTAIHAENKTQWTIEDFSNKDAYEAEFDDHGTMKTVAAYFKEKHGKNCTPRLPVVKMTKKIRKQAVYIPIDFLVIDGNQRYNSKLSDRQTSEMIKFAVTVPAERWKSVMNGVQTLDWSNDEYLRHYGIKINPKPAIVKARVLPSPQVSFAGQGQAASVQPRDLIQGRWRLDGRRFIGQNTKEIGAWGICCIQGRGSLNKAQVENFAKQFVRVFESHGGKVAASRLNKMPHMVEGNLARGGDFISDAWNATGNAFNSRPTFMVFIVNDRNVDVYRRIKKSCDCRYGVPSQVVQSKHAAAASGQYLSNVCMKVNAKLGGATCFAKSVTIPKINPKSSSIPTMIIGADVSHPAPGAGSDTAASFAALTVSSDSTFTRYWAECNTNGKRVEMVTTTNIENHFGNMAKNWMMRVGRGQPPQRILYIRDGVSEGQYAAVLEEEVRDMKETLLKIGCKTLPKFTVVIAGKRHHIRFFPDKSGADRNSNPLPGTLVEAGCTHPFEFDWYMCSHVAIKGTARPIHYQVILNEAEWNGMELQQFIFEHSYQYIRSTTPVSLHPAVYYAHLAADRSRAHENVSAVSSGKKESKAEQKDHGTSTGSSSRNQAEIPPLLPLINSMGLRETMWYI